MSQILMPYRTMNMSDLANLYRYSDKAGLYWNGPFGPECLACNCTDDTMFSYYGCPKHTCKEDSIYYETAEEAAESNY